MAADASALRRRSGASLPARLFGLGSVFGKTIRDSRRSTVVAMLLMGGVMLLVGAAIPSAYPTQAERDQMARLAGDLTSGGLAITGKPVNIATMGGYVQWKYGPVFLVVAAIWSILALTGTLAAEARRSSLDFVVASPLQKRTVAFEKVAAHVVVMAIAIAVMGLAAWLAGAVFGRLAGDAVPVQAAVGYSLWVGSMALAFGGFAFVLAPFLGRGAAAGISGALLIAGWLLSNIADTVPGVAPIADLTPWAWTHGHLPLAGQYDWVSLLPVALVAVVFLVLGIEAFARRDLGVTGSLRTPGLPAVALGVRGPIARAFGERLPLALAWGIGAGLFTLTLAAISRPIANEVNRSPDIERTFRALFPAFDVTSAAGFLQLMAQLMFIVVGFAAATFVAGWAADETSGRAELLLTEPVGRVRLTILNGFGALLSVAVMTAIVALLTAIGAAASGGDALAPAFGIVSLGLYAAALVGIGFAVGGFRASAAGAVVVAVAAATYLVDLIVPALKLPDAVHRLALSADLGQPFVGSWDVTGVAACVLLAFGGIVVGALALQRRDVAR